MRSAPSRTRGLRFLGVVAALTLVVGGATACISDEPSCVDVAYYNEQLNEAGQEEFDEGSVNEEPRLAGSRR
jgi:hypothetical protein